MFLSCHLVNDIRALNNDLVLPKQIRQLKPNISKEILECNQGINISGVFQNSKEYANEYLLEGTNAMRKSILSKYLNSKKSMKERSRANHFPKISKVNRFHHNTIQQTMEEKLATGSEKELIISGYDLIIKCFN